jgi:hypothetical protein
VSFMVLTASTCHLLVWNWGFKVDLALKNTRHD